MPDNIKLYEVLTQTVVSHLHIFEAYRQRFIKFISGLGWYAASSSLSALADVLIFWLFSSIIFQSLSNWHCWWWSTLIARVLSSFLNYSMNCRYVFRGNLGGKTLLKYYFLWVCQLLSSYLLLLLWEQLLPGVYPTVNKALGDIILGICSYQIQACWVFRKEERYAKR